MRRMLSWVLLLSALCVVAVPVAAADKPANNLISVKPSYQEAVAEPSQQVSQNDLFPPAPTPAEQLYVFWLLGKVLSYPVDVMDSYISKKRAEWRAVPVPAAAPAAGPNPFENRSMGQIPPAPPVLSGPSNRP